MLIILLLVVQSRALKTHIRLQNIMQFHVVGETKTDGEFWNSYDGLSVRMVLVKKIRASETNFFLGYFYRTNSGTFNMAETS